MGEGAAIYSHRQTKAWSKFPMISIQYSLFHTSIITHGESTNTTTHAKLPTNHHNNAITPHPPEPLTPFQKHHTLTYSFSSPVATSLVSVHACFSGAACGE
jgi:hypothetical protein